MIVQLIRGLNMSTEVKTVKDGRKFSGCYMPPGIYPDWPTSIPRPKSSKVLAKMPDGAMLEERGLPIIDTLASQTEAMVEKMETSEQVTENVRPTKAPLTDEQIKAQVQANREKMVAQDRAKK